MWGGPSHMRHANGRPLTAARDQMVSTFRDCGARTASDLLLDLPLIVEPLHHSSLRVFLKSRGSQFDLKHFGLQTL